MHPVLFSHAISDPLCLHREQKNCTKQSSSEHVLEHNGFYVCSPHCFKLRVLGWEMVLRDVSRSTCPCMNTAWQAEKRPGLFGGVSGGEGIKRGLFRLVILQVVWWRGACLVSTIASQRKNSLKPVMAEWDEGIPKWTSTCWMESRLTILSHHQWGWPQ